MENRRTLVILTLLLALGLLVACAPAETPAPPEAPAPARPAPGPLGAVEIGPGEPIKIASLLAVSGAVASLGTDTERGIEIAIDDRGGELLGHPIELQKEDDLCNSEGGTTGAQKIVSDPQVVGIIGTSCSGAGVPASRIMSEAGLVMISPSNTSPFLTSLGGEKGNAWQPGYYRTSHNDEVQGRAAATFVYEVLGFRKAASIHDGDPYTQGLVMVFNQVFEELGGEIVEATAVNKGDTDMRPVLTSIAAKGPELIYFPIFQPEGDFIAIQSKEFPELEDVVLMGADGLLSDTYVIIEETKDMYFSGPATPTGTAYNEFVAKYEAKYGEKPIQAFHAHGYDAANMLFDAIEKVAVGLPDGGLFIDRQALRDALYATKGFQGLTGTLTCDEFGDCADPQIEIVRNEDPAAGIEGTRANVVFTYKPGVPVAAPPPAPAEEALVIGTTDSWSSFEISWVYSFHDWEIFHQCADGLLNNVPGTAGEVAPALAESYTVSDDGTVYTFKIREGVVFPDGTPLTADEVVWSLNRVSTIQEIEGDNANFLLTAYVDSIEKVDDMTVKVTFSDSFAFAPQLVATNPWKIINPKQWTDTEANTNNTACGIGPYTITSFTEGEEIVYEANPTYYGDPPREKKVIVRYFADSPTMALALQNGEIDIAWKSLAPADLAALEGVEGITVEKAGGTEIRYIVFNSTTPPFDNPNVRLGLAMLLDREQLTDLGWQGIKVPLYSMVPPGFLGHKPTYEGTENVEEGKKLLAEAGFTEDNPLVMDLWYSPTHYGDTEVDVATVIKQQWEASGVVKVTLRFLEWAAYRDAGRAGEMPVNLLGWYPDYLDPDNYTNVFAHSPASWSGSFYSNPEMDALLEAQAGELDEAARVKILEEIQDLWVKESPFVPLAQGALFVAYRDGISNVILDPLSLFHYFLIEKAP